MNDDTIKRSDAIEALNECTDIKGFEYRQMHDALMAIPINEGKEVVRCKKCRLNETDDCPMVYYTPLEDGGIETRWWNRPDDFCSWGENKDDE